MRRVHTNPRIDPRDFSNFILYLPLLRLDRESGLTVSKAKQSLVIKAANGEKERRDSRGKDDGIRLGDVPREFLFLSRVLVFFLRNERIFENTLGKKQISPLSFLTKEIVPSLIYILTGCNILFRDLSAGYKLKKIIT